MMSFGVETDIQLCTNGSRKLNQRIITLGKVFMVDSMMLKTASICEK